MWWLRQTMESVTTGTNVTYKLDSRSVKALMFVMRKFTCF